MFSAGVAADAALRAPAASSQERAVAIAVREGPAAHLASAHHMRPPARCSRIATPVAIAMDAPTGFADEVPPFPTVDATGFQRIAKHINWDVKGPALARGNLRGVLRMVAEAIRRLFRPREMNQAARTLGIDCVPLAIAQIASSESDGSSSSAQACRCPSHGVDSARFEASLRTVAPHFESPQ